MPLSAISARLFPFAINGSNERGESCGLLRVQFGNGHDYNHDLAQLRHIRAHNRYMNNNIDDETLMLRFQQNGDYAAFESLFRRHKDGFVTFLTRMSGNVTIAEDISQLVWLKLIDVAKEARYSAKAGFRTYLYTLGRNRYIDAYHRKFDETRTESLDETTHAGNPGPVEREQPEMILASDERTRIVNRAIASLPMEQRDVVAMWASGIGFDLIGKITSAPRDTVISRKKYGIKKMRAALEEAGIAGDTL